MTNNEESQQECGKGKFRHWSHLQNSWTAICFSTLAHFLAGISAHSTTMHYIPAKNWPQIGFADYPPRILQVAHWKQYTSLLEKFRTITVTQKKARLQALTKT